MKDLPVFFQGSVAPGDFLRFHIDLIIGNLSIGQTESERRLNSNESGYPSWRTRNQTIGRNNL